jgi:hypothetical protein
MASVALFIASVALLAGCGKQNADNSNPDDQSGKSPNQELYDKVMDIHNEVMPKMDDLYKAKVSLSSRLKETSGISEKEKEEILTKIAQLDSASESMLAWMRQFNPLADSAGEDRARAYLQEEMAKIQSVKTKVLQALDHARSDN